MNILLVSSYLPYPLHSGGHVRLYNLIKELSQKHTITLICEKRPHQTGADSKALEAFCRAVITVPRRKQWSLQNIAKSATSASSFLVTGHTLPDMRKKIEEVLSQDVFDIIHVETFYVLQNVPVTSVPIVLVDHNIEYDVYKRFMQRVPLPVKPLLALDIAKIKKEEVAAWKLATKVVAVSEEDKKVMEKFGVKPSVVSNGVDFDTFSFNPKNPLASVERKEKKILFIGDFKWLQNKDAVTFILKEIFPKIRLQTDAKLWIVAREIPAAIKALSTDPFVLFDEKSSEKSASAIFQEADILLAPIRVGGGTSYKILEAMSCGTPVVTMPMSAHAIHATDEEHILVGKDAQELAEKTIRVLFDEKLVAKVAQNGRKLIEENYSWKNIARDLEIVYKGVVK